MIFLSTMRNFKDWEIQMNFSAPTLFIYLQTCIHHSKGGGKISKYFFLFHIPLLSYITQLLGIVVVVWSSLMGDHLNNAHATTDGIKVENQLERRHVQSAFGTS